MRMSLLAATMLAALAAVPADTRQLMIEDGTMLSRVGADESHWVQKPKNSRQWYSEVLGWLDRWTGRSK